MATAIEELRTLINDSDMPPEARLGKMHAAATRLISAAENDGDRDLTDEEAGVFDLAVRTSKAIKAFRLGFDDPDAGPRAGGLQSINMRPPIRPVGFDNRNEPIYILNKGERLTDLPGGQVVDGPSIGQIVQKMVTGEMRGPANIQAAMSEGSNTLGGNLVNTQLSSEIIDKARAKSATFQAGARLVPMSTETLTLAKVTTDPTMIVHGENETITEDDVELGSINLHAYSLACVVRVSRELAADAGNVTELVGDVLVRALAAEMDRQFLVGSGSQEMTGLVLRDSLPTTSTVGAIAWADLNTAWAGVMSNNHTPLAYILSPTIASDLNGLTSGDGSNSAALWQGPMPGVSDLSRHITTNIGNDQILVGDFSKVLIGIRQNALVEVTTDGGDAFTKHSVLVKVTWRGDIGVTDVTALHLLDGVTT